MRKKVRITLPKLIKDVLSEDLNYFEMKMEKLCNIIIQETGYDPTLRIHDMLKEDIKEQLGFNLTEYNTKIYKNMVKESEETTEAEFFRRLLSTYANLNPVIRERIVFKQRFNLLFAALKSKRKVRVMLHNEIFDLQLIKIIKSSNTGYNHVIAKKFDDKIKEYRIREIEILKIL